MIGFETVLIALITGSLPLVAQYVTSHLSQKREHDTNRLKFRELQIKEVYGPILALCMEIMVTSDQQTRARRNMDQKKEEAKRTLGTIPNSLFEQELKIQDYYVEVQKQNLERYKKVIDLCKNNYYLLETSTKTCLIHIIKHIEAFEFSRGGKLPVTLLDNDFDSLEMTAFLRDIREIHENIRTYVESGDPATIGKLTSKEPDQLTPDLIAQQFLPPALLIEVLDEDEEK